MSPVRRFFTRTADKLGIAYLSREFLTFVRMHGYYTLAVNLSGMFIGAFLLKAGSSVAVVGLYYLLAYLFEGSLYFLMAWLLGRMAPTIFSRLGLVFYGCSYVVLLVFKDEAGQVYPLVALLAALGASFYWLPYHIYSVQYTNLGNRQLSMSLMGVVANLIMLLTPPLSGSIIFFLPGMNGYIAVFIISILSFVAAAITARSMPSQPTGRRGNALISLIKNGLGDRLVSSMTLAHFFFGIRDGMFMYYLNLLIFTTTSNEFVMGINTTGRGLIVIGLYTHIAKYNSARFRGRGAVIVGFAAVAATFGTALWFSAFSIIALSLFDAVVQSFNNNTLQFSSYYVSDYLSEKSGTERRNEIIALRSTVLNAGRVVGIGISLVLPDNLGSPALILMILSILALPSAYYLFRIEAGREA